MVARSSANITSSRVSFDTITIVVVTTLAMMPRAPASTSMVMGHQFIMAKTELVAAPLLRTHVVAGLRRYGISTVVLAGMVM